MSLTPLSFKSELAPNPKSTLKYAAEVKLKSGSFLPVSDPKALRAMVALMDMQAVLGGAASHWGGPSSLAEMVSTLYALAFEVSNKEGKNWYESIQIINDEGHCENVLYALKANHSYADLNIESLKGFRSISSPLTGHGEAHIFPEGVYLSNGPLGSSLPQAQGLALADGLKRSDRVTFTLISDGACMEGEAKEAMAAIPGFASKGQLAPFVMIVNDNKTKLSGRIEDSFSMTPTFESLSALGWEVVTLENAHDLQACMTCFEDVIAKVSANPKKPIAIHAKSIKGYGVKATEEAASGGHGFPLKKPTDLTAFLQEIYKDEDVPKEFQAWTKELIDSVKESGAGSTVKKEKVQVGVAQALIGKATEGLPVVSVSSDLPGSTGVATFIRQFPESSIDVGIAESNMVSVAAGLSKEGFIPVVDTFSQFGVTKGALPFIMSALSKAPMIAIFSHAGFQDAADGASHQSLSYLAMTCSIPHTKVYCLSTSEQAKDLISLAIDDFASKRKANETPDTYIFFLGRETFVPSLGSSYKLGEAKIVFDNSKDHEKSVTVVSCGPLLHQALEAAEKDKSQGYVVVDASIINQPDVKTIESALDKTDGRLITVEDHQKIGGMGSVVTHSLAMAGVDFKIHSLGVDMDFGQSAYKASELYEKHKLDSKAIMAAAQKI